MALVLFGAPVGTNVLIRLDDPALATDEGAAMPEPYYRTAAVDFGPAGGQGRLRRIVQAVTVGADATVEVCPVANGVELTDQATQFAVASVDGSEQRIEHHVASVATRHAVCVRVKALAGPLAFGESDLAMIPKRSTERA